MDKKTAVIFASRPVTAGMRRYVPEDGFVVAADAGWENARKLGVNIHLALGDFDSSPVPTCAEEVICLPPEKDETDTHYAALEVLGRGYKNVVLLGALGGRRDHEMANYHTMLYLAKNGAHVLAADEDFEVRCMGPGTLALRREEWRWLSIFAAGGIARGVTLQGVKYPLKGYTVTGDFPIGVSNEFVAPCAEIHCKEGYLYVMVCK